MSAGFIAIPAHLTKRDQLGPSIRKLLVDEARAENQCRDGQNARERREAVARARGVVDRNEEQKLTIPDAWVTERNVLFVIASPDGDQAPAVEQANKVLAEWDYPIAFDVNTFRENWIVEWVDPAIIAEESWPESGWSTEPVEGWTKVYRVDLDDLSEGAESHAVAVFKDCGHPAVDA